MRNFGVIMGAFAFVIVCLSCEQKERSASSMKLVDKSQEIEQSIQTCIRDIGVKLTPDNVEAPDALFVSFTSTVETANQMMKQGNPVTLIVWKDTSTVNEDSAVYSARHAKIRMVKENEYEVFFSSMGLRDYETNELLVISDEELKKNPQIRIKTKEGEEWTFRSCR